MIIRKANLDDAEGILNIRNDEAIRMISLEKNIISLDQHIGRLTHFLEDKKNILIIAEDNNEVTGYCRINEKDKKNLVSIAISSKYQGRGLGQLVLNEALSNVNRGQQIIAEIIEDNASSIRFFEKNGFIYTGKKDKVCSYIYTKEND